MLKKLAMESSHPEWSAEWAEGPDPATFVPRGFAIINVDARGSGDSDGSVAIMGTEEGEDEYDVTEAIAQMPWCNRNIGMAGNSHLAIVQWFIAALKPPSLKAIAPWEACRDLYRERFVRGGIFDSGLFDFITKHNIQGRCRGFRRDVSNMSEGRLGILERQARRYREYQDSNLHHSFIHQFCSYNGF